jgi:hypothetical protein
MIKIIFEKIIVKKHKKGNNNRKIGLDLNHSFGTGATFFSKQLISDLGDFFVMSKLNLQLSRIFTIL